jgi:O-antigen biosynthesis protein
VEASQPRRAALTTALESPIQDVPLEQLGDRSRWHAPDLDPEQGPPVSFVVCTAGRVEQLARCLAALEQAAVGDDEIIVVDNGSGRTRAPFSSRARWVHEPRAGSSWARNRGLRDARHEIVVYVDDDCVPDRAWSGAIRAPFCDSRVSGVTGAVLARRADYAIPQLVDRAWAFHRGWLPRTFPASTGSRWSPLDAASVGVGVTMAWRRRLLVELGGFDPALGAGTVAGWAEDLDVFRRALAIGAVLVYEPAALAWHDHPETPDALRAMMRRYARAFGAYCAKIAVEERNPRGVLLAARSCARRVRWAVSNSLPGRRRAQIPPALLLLQVPATIAGMAAFLAHRRRLRSGRLAASAAPAPAPPRHPAAASGCEHAEIDLATGFADEPVERPLRLLVRVRGVPAFAADVAAGQRPTEAFAVEHLEALGRFVAGPPAGGEA